MKTESKNNVKGALHPYDTLTREDRPTEWDRLDEALSDRQITNIAVSAPYDTGKSSFLSSYFLQHQIHQFKHPIRGLFSKSITEEELKKDQEKAHKKIRQGKADFRFISVPNFFEDIKGNRNIEVELEKDIIEQLLLSANPIKFPDSSIPRLIRIKLRYIIMIYALLVFLAGLIANVQIKLDRKFEIFIILTIIGAIIFYFLVHFLGKLTIDLSAKFHIGKTKIKAGLTNKEDHNNKDSFVQYNDELSYFFDVTKIRYVIFEDLDRYNTPLIFQRLRALNKRLNSHRDKPIVFIYTTKDSIFDVAKNKKLAIDTISQDDENCAAKQKSKFFDYVISLVPFENVSNSVHFFKQELDKYSWLDVDDEYLYGLGLFITDYREIIAIVSDMAEYFVNVKSNLPTYSGNKLLGAMVYKNVYLSDFNDIYEHKSKLEYLLTENYVLDNYIDQSLRDWRDENGKQTLINVGDDDSLTGKIEFWNKNKDNLSKLGFNNEKLVKAMDFCQNKPILKYLLDNDLIGNDFFNYAFPIKYKDISIEDIDSIQTIVSKRARYNVHINNPESAVIYLDKINFNFKYAYSSDILISLLKKASKFYNRNPKIYKKCEERASVILQTVEKNNDYDFMSTTMQDLLKDADIRSRDIFMYLAFEDPEYGYPNSGYIGIWPDYFIMLFVGFGGEKIYEEIGLKFIINYWNEYEKYDEHYICLRTMANNEFFDKFKEYIKDIPSYEINKTKVWMIEIFNELEYKSDAPEYSSGKLDFYLPDDADFADL